MCLRFKCGIHFCLDIRQLCCVKATHTGRIIRIAASSAEPKLAYFFGLQERTFFRKFSNRLAMAGMLELLKRTVGTAQKENIDLHSIKTVFYGSKQLKMKMERPSRPTRPSGVIARWFLPCPRFALTARDNIFLLN
jgi:hypothetical protein